MSGRSFGMYPSTPDQPVLYSVSAPGIPGADSDSCIVGERTEFQCLAYSEFFGGTVSTPFRSAFCAWAVPGTLASAYMMSCGLTKLTIMKNGCPDARSLGTLPRSHRTLSLAVYTSVL